MPTANPEYVVAPTRAPAPVVETPEPVTEESPVAEPVVEQPPA